MKHRLTLILFLVLPLLTVGLGYGQATAPSADDEPRMEAAIRALREQRYAEARDLFSTIAQADPRNPRALHGQGLALLLLSEPAKALPLLERAASLAPPDRSLVINLASAHLQTRNTMRAIKLLRDHLANHPRPLDEPALRALEAALASADASARKNRVWIDAATLAESYGKLIESARPGWKRWGSEWRPAEEVDKLRSKSDSNRRVVERLNADIAKIQKAIEDLQQQLQQSENRPRRGPGRRLEIEAQRERIRGLEATLQRQQAERDRLVVEAVEPKFDSLIPPVGIGELPPPIEPPSDAGSSVSPPAVPAPPPPATNPSEEDDPIIIVPPPATTPAPPLTVPEDRPPRREERRDAVAIAITRDLLLVPLAVTRGTTHLEVQIPGTTRLGAARIVREDAGSGVALLRIDAGIALRAIPLAERAEEGPLTCVGFGGTDLFQAIPVAAQATLVRTTDGWRLDGDRLPELNGAALCRDGRLLGLVLDHAGEQRVIDVSSLRQLIADDAARAPNAPLPDPRAAVLHLSATIRGEPARP